MPEPNGTAVLLQFSGLQSVHLYLNQVNGIYNNGGRCVQRYRQHHDHHCQFDVVAVAAGCQSDTTQILTEPEASAAPRTYASVVKGVSAQAAVSTATETVTGNTVGVSVGGKYMCRIIGEVVLILSRKYN